MNKIVSKQFSSVQQLQIIEPVMYSWEDISVNCAFITKAVYYAGKDRNKSVVSYNEILEWLKKYEYNFSEPGIVQKTLLILFSTGVIARHNDGTNVEKWEWQLK